MSIRYCIRCQKAVDDTQAIHTNAAFFCPICKKPLRYLGREAASISSQKILEEYDQTHPMTDATQYFTGRYRHYHTPPLDLETLEHQDMLNRIPDHYESHFNLGLIFKSRQDILNAIKHFTICHTQQNTDERVLRHLADCAIATENYPQAITYLNQLTESQSNSFSVFYNLGIAHALNKTIDDARTAFETAKKMVKTDAQKEEIDALIKQLQ